MAWNRAQNEELISLYKGYPLLYKAHLPGSHDKAKREEAYFQIAYEIQDIRQGTTVEEIKSRIKNLRTQYFREQKRITSLGMQGRDVIKLWCYDNLKFLDDEDEQRVECATSSMKLETEEFIEENLENDIGTSGTFYSDHQYLEDELGQEDDMLSNVGFESASGDDELNVGDSVDAIETLYSAKRFRTNDNDVTSSVKMNRLVHNSSECEVEACDDGNLPESLAAKLNETLDRANALLNKLAYKKQSQNRPFIENLLLDLNKLPADALRRTKWRIADIVYQAHQEHHQRKNSMLSS